MVDRWKCRGDTARPSQMLDLTVGSNILLSGPKFSSLDIANQLDGEKVVDRGR